jgi:putative hydrolase of the HAD superfamily
MGRFSHIETWVFDLDNTIYNANAHVFVEMQRLMQDYMTAELGIPAHEAGAARERLWRKHGTTLRGLMHEYNVDPHDFLARSHAIDLDPVPQDAVLVDHLGRLPGRKFIFSNTTRGFATRMTDHLGIGPHFEGVFVIEDSSFWPKPDPRAFEAFVKKYDIEPKTACMFEDSLPNLETAHGVGMTTVWIYGYHDRHMHDPRGEALLPYVDDRAESLNGWLAAHLSERITKEGHHDSSVR